MPDNFSLGANDTKVLAYINVVLQDYNTFPVATTENIDSIVSNPQGLQIVLFGCSVFAAMFTQLNAGLIDFSFSDQGFSVQVNQVEKLQASIANMTEVYKRMIVQYKTNLILDQGPQAISSPRYQSQLGQFLKISLGSAFNWNSP